MLVLLPFASIIFLQAWQLYVKHEAKERLEKALLETIVLQKDQFYWEEEGKEISMGGKLFDVKSFVVKGDKTIVTGIFDEKETAISAMLSGQAADDHLLIALLAWTQFFLSMVIICFSINLPRQVLRYLYPYSNSYKNICRKLLTPPPRFSFS